MENIDLSIIIPVFNGDKCISQCVDSLLSQSDCNINYEIIIVNDGSTDHTKEICEIYEKTYSNIKLINLNNSGVSKARNVGLENAKGAWIAFCDSDDTVTKYWISHLDINNNKNYDILISGFWCDNWMYKGECKVGIQRNRTKDSNSSIIKLLFEKNMLGFVWNKLFKLETISTFNIRFDEKFTYKEDMLFCLNYLERCNSVKYINSFDYKYKFSETLSKFKKQDSFLVNLKISDKLKKLLSKNEYILTEPFLMHETASAYLDSFYGENRNYSIAKNRWENMVKLFEGRRIRTTNRKFNFCYFQNNFEITYLFMVFLTLK